MTALVPYTGSKIVQYLENLLPSNSASEISKEWVYKSHYKQVQRIISEDKYDFRNAPPINMEK